MYISKTRFLNWTRCVMYYPMDLKENPTGMPDIDAERERREEMLEEMDSSMNQSENYQSDESEDSEKEERFDATPRLELDALLPFYSQVEEEALKVAKKYFHGTFINQKLFEYELNGNTYRCYVDIYNESDKEINIIEVKATTSSKYVLTKEGNGKPKGLYFSIKNPDDRRKSIPFSLFVQKNNIWHFNVTESRKSEEATTNFENKKKALLDRYGIGKNPHDLAFQRFVIENALREAGDNRPVNYYLAVLNHEYVYDGAVDDTGTRIYNEIDGQEIVTFFDMNETTKAYQDPNYENSILKEIEKLEGYISEPLHNVEETVKVGKFCAWGEKTECPFCKHCFEELRPVPKTNKSNNYINFRSFRDADNNTTYDKYGLINAGYYNLDDVPSQWVTHQNHKIQRKYYKSGTEHIDKDKIEYWFKEVINYPIYHFDFEAFPCPLPRFKGEKPYQQSVFEFSLHIEREPGVCDKDNKKDNYIFLNNENNDDEREALAKAIVDHFEFNDDGKLHGTMLAQYTSYEKQRLTELADLFPEYKEKLLAIKEKSADLIHLLRTNEELYTDDFGKEHANRINYYHKKLSGSYSIKKTLPVLVPTLSYDDMDVGNGVQAYITYLNYDSPDPTFATEDKPGLKTKEERKEALKRYCQQDTWAMVEILRAVRKKIEDKD